MQFLFYSCFLLSGFFICKIYSEYSNIFLTFQFKSLNIEVHCSLKGYHRSLSSFTISGTNLPQSDNNIIYYRWHDLCTMQNQISLHEELKKQINWTLSYLNDAKKNLNNHFNCSAPLAQQNPTHTEAPKWQKCNNISLNRLLILKKIQKDKQLEF